jgi:RNA-directed DNA polymerase
MSVWRPQIYRASAPPGTDPAVLDNAVAIGSAIIRVNAALPPLFSLRHLAHILDADYGLLRAMVARRSEDSYKSVRLRKRPRPDGKPRFRTICVPSPTLMAVQRWINARVLSCVAPHSASMAFAKENTTLAAAERHCAHPWLIKFDVVSFFESIPETAVYRVFHSLGYQPLVAFELSRLCTRLGPVPSFRQRRRWRTNPERYPIIAAYASSRIGHLPQGAPTSPMLLLNCVN